MEDEPNIKPGVTGLEGWHLVRMWGAALFMTCALPGPLIVGFATLLYQLHVDHCVIAVVSTALFEASLIYRFWRYTIDRVRDKAVRDRDELRRWLAERSTP